jgi:glycosyltransferase involved in cell wall biosynthesis
MPRNSILLLTNSYPDFESSSRAVFIKRLAQLLQKEGYSISVVTPKIYKGSRYFEEEDGIKIYRFPFWASNKLLIEYKKIPYLKMILYFITGFFVASYVLLRNRCRLIHAHWAIPTGLIGALIGKLLKKPVVATVHGSDFRMATEKSNFLRDLFLYVCRNAEHVNCVSEMMRIEIERMGVKAEKISVFPMGIDEAFYQVGRERKPRSNRFPRTILSNRNLLPIYNVSLLIRAIPIILNRESDVQFLIAGDGPERTHLEKEAENLKIMSSVKFLGRIPHQEMANLLAQSEIYVSTSLADGTSVSLLEAMGAGAFPVVTDIPANREWVINGENGFLIPTDEPTALAKGIIEAIHNRELLEKGRRNNSEIIEEKALWMSNIKKIREIYAALSSAVA